MARQAGVPVVPIAIKNSDALMGKGTGEARSGTIEIVIMEPLSTEQVQSDQDINDLVVKVRQRIADELKL
jgi:1-acyl-sn-glycerol-3-phosphate acyltransferase